jgi:hypothetical protein
VIRNQIIIVLLFISSKLSLVNMLSNTIYSETEMREQRLKKFTFDIKRTKKKNNELDDETNSIFTVSRKICIQISLENINTVL